MKFLLTFIIVFIIVSMVVVSLYKVILPFYQEKFKKKLPFKPAERVCDQMEFELWWKNLSTYFWVKPIRFVWIAIALFFLIALSLSLNEHDGVLGLLFALFFAIVASLFFYWARLTYKAYPEHAKAELTAFEKVIEEGVRKEISFEGDNIQKFSSKDSEFDTDPNIFKFPVEVVKAEYPLFSGKKIVVHEQKLEFLILSREYLSICKGATKFKLLDPIRLKKADIKKDKKKKCGLTKKAGECHEYYYSLIKNVKYEDGGIKIIFHDANEEPAIFKCKKNPKAMKALHEKLRLTERQRLKKIDEQYRYEAIKDKRQPLDE